MVKPPPKPLGWWRAPNLFFDHPAGEKTVVGGDKVKLFCAPCFEERLGSELNNDHREVQLGLRTASAIRDNKTIRDYCMHHLSLTRSLY